MRIRFFGLLLLATFVFVLSCATLDQFVQPPDVKVENVNITDFSFEDITLDFGLLVSNPNAFGAALEGYAYQFAIQGNEFLSADESRQINVGASSASNVNIPVTINFKKLYDLMQQTKELDSLSYELTGSFKPGGMLSAFDIPFSRAGKLPNVRVPQIKFSGLKVNKMGLTGIDLELGLDLVNKNAFGFNVGELNYDVALAGSQLVKGSTDKLASVPANGTSEITLPVSLDFSGALGSLASVLRGNSVQATIKGNTDLTTPFGQVNFPFNTTQDIPITR